MKYYIIAGEASGDLHGSNLVKEIGRLDAGAVFRGWGGDMMQAEGVDIVMHNRNTSFMGFVEVAMNLRTILGFLKQCKNDILDYKPDTVILIDYPGFNLRMARFAHEQGIKVVYYISPQVWAWKASRVKIIRKYVDRMLVILPFEKEFYGRYGYNVDFVGHPLLDVIQNFDPQPLPEEQEIPIIALVPGSRKQEISKMLPVMIKVAGRFPGYRFIIAGVNHVPPGLYKSITGTGKFEIRYGSTYNLLLSSKAALVTSGTATLETALLGIPEVVCYKGNRISYMIAKQIVNIKFISLVNLVMDREVVKELIQDEMNADMISSELKKILDDPAYRQKMLDSFSELKNKLGGPGASARAAALITGR